MAVIEIAPMNLGLFLDRRPFAVPPRGVSAARNCRIRQGRIVRDAMGWSSFHDIVLNGPVLLIDSFRTRDGSHSLVFGTPSDLYLFNETTRAVSFLTPRYGTGTVAAIQTNPNLIGTGTLWSAANLRVDDWIAPDLTNETDPDANWYQIDAIDYDTQIVTLDRPYEGTTGSGKAYTGRRIFHGTSEGWKSASFFNAQPAGVDHWYATNGVDGVVRWDSNANQVTVLDLGFTCRWLKLFKRMMLYGDITESGNRKSNIVRNSALEEPENVSTLEAGEFVGTEISDRLVGGLQLGDFFVCYGELGSLTLVQFVGAPLMFVIRTVSTTSGSVSGSAIIDQGDAHRFLTRTGLGSFDGVSVTRVGEHVFREVMRAFPPRREHQALALRDDENGEYLFVVPQSSDPGSDTTATPVTAWVENHLEPVGSKNPPPILPRDLPATAIGEHERVSSLRFSDLVETFAASGRRWDDRFFAAGFPRKLFGTATGAIYELGVADSQDGAPIDSYARSARFAMGSDGRRGFLRRLEPLVAEEQGASGYELAVEVLCYESNEGSLEETVELGYDLTLEGPRWLAPRALARFIEVQWGTDGADEPWMLSGFRAWIEQGGERR